MTLVNRGSRVAEFDTCPTYRQLLHVGQQVVSGDWQLNCSDVPVLDPAQPVRFAMRLAVPADTPAGRATLSWGLGLSSAFDIKTVTVTK